jgi:hypothetical protein
MLQCPNPARAALSLLSTVRRLRFSGFADPAFQRSALQIGPDRKPAQHPLQILLIF